MKRLLSSLVILLGLLTGCTSENSTSIGIIGGADGPISVFVAGKISWIGIASVILIVVLVVVAIIYFIKRNK